MISVFGYVTFTDKGHLERHSGGLKASGQSDALPGAIEVSIGSLNEGAAARRAYDPSELPCSCKVHPHSSRISCSYTYRRSLER